jgi:hypothetical protein
VTRQTIGRDGAVYFASHEVVGDLVEAINGVDADVAVIAAARLLAALVSLRVENQERFARAIDALRPVLIEEYLWLMMNYHGAPDDGVES